MRTMALTILGIGTILAATPTHAQTYDPNYPICLQTYGRDGNYIQCAYSSLAQCNMSASGRAAQCLTNPYFAYGSKVPPGRIYRRHYRVY